jgi:hypothetical protein
MAQREYLGSMRSPDCRRYAPLSGEAKYRVGGRPSKCIIIKKKNLDHPLSRDSDFGLFILELPFGSEKSVSEAVETFGNRIYMTVWRLVQNEYFR